MRSYSRCLGVAALLLVVAAEAATAGSGAPVVRLLIDDSYPLNRETASGNYTGVGPELYVYLVVDSTLGGYVSGLDLELHVEADTSLVSIGATSLYEGFQALSDSLAYLEEAPDAPGVEGGVAFAYWPVVLRDSLDSTALFTIGARAASSFSTPIVFDRYQNPRIPQVIYSASINTSPVAARTYPVGDRPFPPRNEFGGLISRSSSVVESGRIFVEVAPQVIPGNILPHEDVSCASLQDSALGGALIAAGCSTLKRIFHTPPDSLGLKRNGDPLVAIDASRCLIGEIEGSVDPDSLATELVIMSSVSEASAVPTSEPPWDDPNDPRFVLQQNLQRIGAQEAWGRAGLTALRDESIVVPMIDTGINNVDEFCYGADSKVIAGWNYVDDNSEWADSDTPCDLHGTKAAGVMAATTNNESETAGMSGGWDDPPTLVCSGHRMAALKVYPNRQYPNQCYLDAAGDASALYDATLFSSTYAISCNGILFDYFYPLWVGAYQSFINWGVVCAAKHNGGTDNQDDGENLNSFPGDIADSWEVSGGASTLADDDHRALYSNYGGNIDLLAPAEAYTVDGMTFSGTSSATPLTAGAVAVLLSRHQTLHVEDCENLLESCCRDVTWDPVGGGNLVGYDEYSGWGRLDIGKSLRFADVSGNWLHHGAASGSYSVARENTGGVNFVYGDPYNCEHDYLAAGRWYGYRHDVRVDVTFEQPYQGGPTGGAPRVWGMSETSTGWSAMNPNFRIGWSAVVPGTVTTTGCQMRTYVYDLYNNLGRPIGWWPCRPENVSVGYGLLGIPIAASVGDARGRATTRNVTVRDRGAAGVEFELHGAVGDDVSCDVFDVTGRGVANVVAGILAAPERTATWNRRTDQGTRAGCGVYFFSVHIGDYSRTGKIVVVDH
jgi:hypothetical protein